jgi:integrase
VAKVKVELEPGRWVARSTGTRDPATVKRIQEMVRALGRRGARAWDVLGRLEGQDPWSLMELYERYERHRGDVVAVRGELDDAPLEDSHAAFLKDVASRRTAKTAAYYKVHLLSLATHGITRRSHLTVGRLARWVAALEGKGATRRKYAAGVSVFCSWLVRDGQLAANPMRDVLKPSAGPPRMSFLETVDAIRLADAQASPYRELSALLAGTGLDLSVALGLRRSQIDLKTWGIHSRRAKTQRAHTILIADWARPYVEKLCAGMIGDAPLFGAGVDRWTASDSHRAACTALKLPSYWLRDARHTWAVRFARAGGSAAQGAEQLGHSDGGVLFLKVYSRYVPSLAEREQVERRAAANDAGGGR